MIAHKLLESVYTSAIREVANLRKRNKLNGRYSSGEIQGGVAEKRLRILTMKRNKVLSTGNGPEQRWAVLNRESHF